MKKLLLILLCLPMIGFGQADANLVNASFGNYSSYYGKVDVNVKKNVKKDVTIRKTIKTIDYGQLALANAEKEKNRLANIKYTDEKEKGIAIDIANEPINAFSYGYLNIWKVKHSNAKARGFWKCTFSHQRPHKALFTDLKNWKYQNISKENIVTLIDIQLPENPERNIKKYKETYKNNSCFEILSGGVEEYAKSKHLKEGELYNWGFLHKKDVNKTKVYGKSGFLQTLIYEDDYEYIIKDTYLAVDDGIIFSAEVKYSGDKDEITFEDLEGRRYYLRRLCNQTISTGRLYDYRKY